MPSSVSFPREMAAAAPASGAALARIVADEALMAAIPADAVRKIEDELSRRDEEVKAERIQAEKDNVVKGGRVCNDMGGAERPKECREIEKWLMLFKIQILSQGWHAVSFLRDSAKLGILSCRPPGETLVTLSIQVLLLSLSPQLCLDQAWSRLSFMR